ncbi:MAG TPA: CDP-diacylglycerol--glycerol-3-phosphate 3-phosphatidyltransferase [Acholeplasma sp.]|nr:CDP-diacylglycerol--glycerol-3-phosphate 3-phosphatidyltransferase [Acholeplasma sp.]
MTTANKITLFRFIMIPIMVIILYITPLRKINTIFDMSLATLLFAILFIIASLSDFLDGYIARKYNQVTTFGKFLDPIADKVLVFTALFYLLILSQDRVPLWTVVVIMTREFMVTAIRLLAVEKNEVIAASKWGKYKTATTMVAIIIMLFNDFGLAQINSNLIWIGNSIYYLAVFFTVFSGLDYFMKNKNVVLESI